MKFVKYSLVCLLTVSAAQAATVSVSAGFGATSGMVVQNSAGTAIGAQSWFAAGTFAVVPTVIAGDAASFLNAVNSFSIFSSSLTQPAAPFKIAQSFSGTTNGATFNNQPIWFILGNGVNKDSSTEFAIFTTANNTLFPADIAQPGGPNITLANVGAIKMLNNVGTAVDLAGPDAIRLAVAIPEPSTMLLGALGALGLLRRRR